MTVPELGAESLSARALEALRACGAEPPPASPTAPLAVVSPIDAEELFELEGASAADAAGAAAQAAEVAVAWRASAAAERAALVAAIGHGIEERRAELAELIAIETGKLMRVAAEEVEAAARACVLAAGAAKRIAPLPALGSTQTRGRFEARRPLGPVAVVGSFELPLLDWAAAAPLALACGSPVVWKPEAPLVATALGAIVAAAARSTVVHLPGLHQVVLGESDAADMLAEAAAIELVVRPRPGGTNVAVVAAAADLAAATRSLTAATMAGAGRSSASLRLVFAHRSIAAPLADQLTAAFAGVAIGDPLAPGTELGPLRGLDAYRDHLDAVQTAEAEGGELLAGGAARDLDDFPSGYYVEPTLVRAPALLVEAGSPLLFLASYEDLDEALVRRDAVAWRWSALFGADDGEAARFLAAPAPADGWLAVGSTPTEADLRAPGEYAWLDFSRRLGGRVG